MSFTKPIAVDNQQIIAADFNELAGLPEELLRRFFQNMVVGSGTYGWVLHGLGVTDTSAGAVTSVQIGSGACILPSSAGDNGYRLLIVPANIDVPLTLPMAGTRTDVIQIVLQETQTGNDARYVRSLGPGGQPQAVQENINTQIRVTGAESVNEGGGAVASPGAVRLASVAMDDTEITEITDLRTYALPVVPFGTFPSARFTSLSDMSFYLSGVLSNVYDRLGVNIDGSGRLKATLDTAEGPDVTLNAAEMDIGARDLVVDGAVSATGEGDFAGVRVGHENVPEDFRASEDFLKVNGASSCRLIGKAFITLAWDGVDSFDFSAMDVGGHGISIVRDGPGTYTVTIDAAVAVTGVETFDNSAGTQPQYSVTAQIDPYTRRQGGSDVNADIDAWQLVNCMAYRLRGSDADNVFRVVIRLADGEPDPALGTGLDRSFTVRVFGPFVAPV